MDPVSFERVQDSLKFLDQTNLEQLSLSVTQLRLDRPLLNKLVSILFLTDLNLWLNLYWSHFRSASFSIYQQKSRLCVPRCDLYFDAPLI